MSEQRLELQITASSSEAEKALTALEGALRKVKDATKGGFGLSKAARGIDKLNRAVQNAASAGTAEQLNKLAFALERISKFSDMKMPDLKGFSKVQRAMKSVSDTKTSRGMKQQTTDIINYADAARSLSTIPEPTGWQFAEEQTKYYKTFSEMSKYVRQMKKLPPAMEDWKMGAIPVDGTVFSDTMGDIPAQAAAAVDGVRTLGQEVETESGEFTDFSHRVKDAEEAIGFLGKRLIHAVRAGRTSSGTISKLSSAFGRIAFYRGVRSVIKLVSEAFREGTENVRKYSESIGGSFAKDMSAATATLGTLKNSVGAATAPLLQMLIPALSAVASFAITAFNALNQLFSLLRGAGSWTRAKSMADSLDNVKKSAGGAGGAIKGLLADWDELNIIQSQGGGGGGGTEGIEYEDMFEEVFEYDEKLKAIITWAQEHLDIVKAAAIAIGAAFLTWGFTKEFTNDLGTTLRVTLGIGIAVYGVVSAYSALKDQWNNGVDVENMRELFKSLGLAVAGLGIAFGLKGLGFGLVAAGLATWVAPIKEFVEEINKGKSAMEAFRSVSDEAFAQFEIGIVSIGIGISLLTGNWIPVAIAGLTGLILGVVRDWEDIKYAWEMTWESLKDSANDALAAIIDFFTPAANWIIEKINFVLSAINELLSALGAEKIELIPLIDAEQLKRDLHLVKETVQEVQEGIVPDKELGEQAGLTYDNWKEALAAYETFEPGFYTPTAFWDMAVQPLLDEVLENAGIVGEAGETISNEFFKAWQQSNLSSDYEGEIEKLISRLNELIISNGGFIPLDPKDFEDNTAAAGDSVRGYEETVKELNETTAFAAVTQDDYLQTIKQGVNELNAQGYASFEEKLEAVNRLVEEGQNAMQEAREEAEAYGGTMAGVAVAIPTETQTLVMPDVVQMPESASFDYEVDTGSVTSLYDSIYEALLNYEPDGSMLGARHYWAEALQPLVDDMITDAGYTGDAASQLSQLFYKKFWASLFDETYEGDFDSPLKILQEALESPEDWEIPTIDDSAMDTGLSNSVTKVQGYVNSIRAALESLNGVGFSFGWSGFGGTFKTVGMAAEGGMFTAGQLFIAREAGPEMIGQMGSRSTVANNDQIVTGIAGGVAAGQQEQNALLRQQNDLLMRMLNKKFTAEVVPSAALAKVNRRSEEMYARNTGVSG